MAFGKWLRNLWHREHSEAPEQMYALKTDAQDTANILARARDSIQTEKTTTAVRQLEQIWAGDERQQNLVMVMLMIDETYPQLEKMADLDFMTADWLAELTRAMEIAHAGMEQLDRDQKELSRVLDEIESRTRRSSSSGKGVRLGIGAESLAQAADAMSFTPRLCSALRTVS